MILNRQILYGCVICSALIFLVGAAGATDTATVNVMIGADIYPGSTEMTADEKLNLEMNSIVQMLNEIDPLGLNVTVYVTGTTYRSLQGRPCTSST